MTDTLTQRRERKPREKRPDGVWVTDDELIERSGVPQDIMRRALGAMDRDQKSGFPKKNPLYGGRRYWPAVQEYWSYTNTNPQARRIA
jgi:hypothetical protein